MGEGQSAVNRSCACVRACAPQNKAWPATMMQNPMGMKKSPSGQGPVGASLETERPCQIDADLEDQPLLLQSELRKIQQRSRCHTCVIVSQTVLLTTIRIAGVAVLYVQFQNLNDQVSSLAKTGELARPLLMDADNLTGTITNLTNGLGLTGNGSFINGVNNLGQQVSTAGQDIFNQLSDGINSLISGSSGGGGNASG